MLRIRYIKKTGLLTGWGAGFKARNINEAVATLPIPKPDNDDYENFRYVYGVLAPSGKPKPVTRRNYIRELDDLKIRVKDLEDAQ